jgi:hypothetical protein
LRRQIMPRHFPRADLRFISARPRAQDVVDRLDLLA